MEEDHDSLRTFTTARFEGQNGGNSNPRNVKPPKSEISENIQAGNSGVPVKEETAKGIFTENIQTSGAYCAREEVLKKEVISNIITCILILDPV